MNNNKLINLHTELGIRDISTKYEVSLKNNSLVSIYSYKKLDLFDKAVKVITDNYSSIFKESNIGYILCDIDKTITVIRPNTTIKED